LIGIKPSRPPTDTVGAWHYDIVGTGGHLDRDFLDAITRTLPLIVWDASEQFVYGNSARSRRTALPRRSKPLGLLASLQKSRLVLHVTHD
jgi:hypothetical protein